MIRLDSRSTPEFASEVSRRDEYKRAPMFVLNHQLCFHQAEQVGACRLIGDIVAAAMTFDCVRFVGMAQSVKQKRTLAVVELFCELCARFEQCFRAVLRFALSG